MKKITGLIVVCMLLSLNLHALTAKEARDITKKNEQRIVNEVLKDKKLKPIYDKFFKILNKEIKDTGKNGFTYSLWLNYKSKAVSMLNKLKDKKKLKDTEFRKLKKAIETKLINDGYVLKIGRFDSDTNFHLLLNW